MTWLKQTKNYIKKNTYNQSNPHVTSQNLFIKFRNITLIIYLNLNRSLKSKKLTEIKRQKKSTKLTTALDKNKIG